MYLPVQDPNSRSQVKNPSQDPKPRFQTKNKSHNCCLYVCLFVCLFVCFFHNSRVENDSQKCHIRDVCTTAKNPQSNAICKRMHRTGRKCPKNIIILWTTTKYCQCKKIVDEALSIVMHAMRARIHSTLGSSPGSPVCNRYMFLNRPLITNWHAITQKREHVIHKNLMQENQKRRWYDYLPEQGILKKRWKPCKLDKRTSRLYKVLQTHVNSTVTIELRQRVSERLNIWRVILYKEWMLILIR